MKTINFMGKFGIVGLILLFATNTFGQSATGTVRDADTNNPLSGVIVEIKGTGIKVTTNGYGYFSVGGGGTAIGHTDYHNSMFTNYRAGIRIFDVMGKRINEKNNLKCGLYLIENGGVLSKYVVFSDQIIPEKNIKNLHSNITPNAKTAVAAITIEAETMSLNGYIIDQNRMNGKGIMLDPKFPVPTTGSATKTFTGSSGNYNITIHIAPENDGQPIMRLYVNSKLIGSKTYPINPLFIDPNKDRAEIIFSGVSLTSGNIIKIEGTSAYDVSPTAIAYARVDKIVISDGNDIILVFNKEGYIIQEVAARLGESKDVYLKARPKTGEKPGPFNTGYSGTLTPYSGPMTITTSNTTIENKLISGTLVIKANNVTIRNFKFSSCSWYCIDVKSGSGHLFEDGELINAKSAHIKGGNFTARRLNLHDSAGDAMKPTGNVLVEACYAHKLGTAVDAHADAIQIRGGSNMTFRGNNFDIPINSKGGPGSPYKSNATFMMYASLSPVSNITIDSNWLNGGNYTLFATTTRGSFTKCYVTNNRFGKGYRYGIKAGDGFTTWSGNVWDDSGLPAN